MNIILITIIAVIIANAFHVEEAPLMSTCPEPEMTEEEIQAQAIRNQQRAHEAFLNYKARRES